MAEAAANPADEPSSESTSTESTAIRPSSAIEEIVISAKRQGVTLQQLSSSVTAIGSDDIRQVQIQDTRDLAIRVPSLVTGEAFGTPQIFIRGIGQEATTSGQDPGVAVHVDGIYLGRVFAAYAAQIDVDRVEVFRGPQGTLFGRNATGGSVNYFSRKPTEEFEAEVTALGGNFGRHKFTGVLNGPLVEGLAGRVAVAYDKRGGYVDDLNENNTRELGDSEISFARGGLAWLPDLPLKATLTVDASKEKAGQPATVLLDVPQDLAYANQVEGRDYVVVRDERRVVQSDHAVRPIFTDQEFAGAALRLEWLPEIFNVVSLTGFRNSNYDNSNDGDATRLDFQGAFVERDGRQLSQEFNVSGDWGPIAGVVGLYGFWENATEENDVRLAQGLKPPPGYTANPPLPPFNLFYNMDQDTTSYAGFTEVTYSVLEFLRLVGGFRYTHDEKETAQQLFIRFPGVPGVVDTCPATPSAGPTPSTGHTTASWSNLSGKGAVELDLSDSYTTYGLVSQGFKAGGFGDFSPCGSKYDPELATNYELGLKGSPFDGALTFQLSAFRMDYQDLQVQVVEGASVTTINAASASINGGEGQFRFLLDNLVDGLSIDGMLSILKSEYEDFLFGAALSRTGDPVQLAGFPITRSPKASGLLGFDLSRPVGADLGTLTGRLEGYATSSYSLNPIGDRTENGRPYFVQDEYFLGNFFLTYSSVFWVPVSAQAFVRNFTDAFYFNSVVPYGTIVATNGFPALGRTWGLEVSVKF